jgi:hypothetical protein
VALFPAFTDCSSDLPCYFSEPSRKFSFFQRTLQVMFLSFGISLSFPESALGFNLIRSGNFKLKPADVEFHHSISGPQIEDIYTFEDGIYANYPPELLWQTLVKRSLDLWNNVPNINLKLKQKIVSEDIQANDEDGIFSISINKDFPFSVAAQARPRFKDSSKAIRDCDIELGTNYSSIRSILFSLSHEIGHCIGLGHNHADSSSLMSYSNIGREFRLGLDDMAGALFLYPNENNNQKPQNYIPCGKIQSIHQVRKFESKQSEGKTKNRNLISKLLLFVPLIAVILNQKYRQRQFLNLRK